MLLAIILFQMKNAMKNLGKTFYQILIWQKVSACQKEMAFLLAAN